MEPLDLVGKRPYKSLMTHEFNCFENGLGTKAYAMQSQHRWDPDVSDHTCDAGSKRNAFGIIIRISHPAL